MTLLIIILRVRDENEDKLEWPLPPGMVNFFNIYGDRGYTYEWERQQELEAQTLLEPQVSLFSFFFFLFH